MRARSALRLRTSAFGAAALTLLGIGLTALPGTADAAPAPQKHAAAEQRGFYDARQGASPAEAAELAWRATELNAAAGPRALRSALGSQPLVDIDPLAGTPRQVQRLDGFLTGPSRSSAPAVALGYVRAHSAVFRLSARDLAGLRQTRDYVDVAGIHHLSWTQSAGGVPVFGNGLQANVTRDGRLVSVLGAPIAGLTGPAASRRITAAAAIGTARRDLAERSLAAGPADRVTPVLFQTPGGLRQAWQTITMSTHRPALHVIDAGSGRILYRRSLSSDADGKAFTYFPKAPRGGAQAKLNFTGLGWLPATATKLAGNNTHTYADVNDSNKAEANEEIPPRQGHSWDYPLVPFHPHASFCSNPYPCSWNPDVPFSWRTNRNQNATQVFSFVNNWHDHLAAAPIGFSEAAGNFQKVNFSGKGKGRDAVEAQSDDGASIDHGLPDGNHVDNANMSTPPDGMSPTMQMYLQHLPGTTYPGGDPFAPTNVGDEADTVYHEYTHGLSNRLVVDAAGNSTLGNVQAGAMGEAWSDWYAMDYLVDQGVQIDRPASGDVVLFQYDGAGVAVDRTEPIDCAVGTTAPACPGTGTAGRGGYTYGDFGQVIGRPEVHADGEIWAQTLWDLRRKIGSVVAENLVTRAMSLSPANPSFLDERNAILQADTAVYGGGNRARIWSVFARRGMGFFAAAINGDDTTPVESFAMPPAPGSPKGTITGTVTDRQGGHPLAGARVAFGGHASGFPGDYSDTTGADGHYRITGIFTGKYDKISASKPGFDPRFSTANITSGTLHRSFSLIRDWAAASGGAAVRSFTGPDFSGFGCGPRAAIDQALGTGWGSTSDLVNGKPGPKTPKSITVKLPKAVDIRAFAVDPNATCGDGGSAATADYRIETSTDGKGFKVSAAGVFAQNDLGRLNNVAAKAGTAKGVRFVRFTMIKPQVFEIGGSCPGAYSGCDFLDLSELEVYGS